MKELGFDEPAAHIYKELVNLNQNKMKAKLNKVDNGYVLLVDNIMHATDNDKLSKQNCDDIFRVTDVDKLAKNEYLDGYDNTEMCRIAFKDGFNKAMELYQPTEIDVEIVMECLDPNCDGINKKGVCIPGDKPNLDSSGNLILKRK